MIDLSLCAFHSRINFRPRGHLFARELPTAAGPCRGYLRRSPGCPSDCSIGEINAR